MEHDSRMISASLLRLRMKSPFFATLALFARFIPTRHHSTAATDGRDVYYNPEFLRSLPPAQLDSVLLHEVLHAALLHVPRRGSREPETWICAADIVVNGIILQQGTFELPSGALREPTLEHFSVEEVYELLLKRSQPVICLYPDLLAQPPDDAQGNPGAGEGGATAPGLFAGGTIGQAQKAALESHWKNALQQAMAIAHTINQGSLPAGMTRELDGLTRPQLDWRSHLWRYLVKTPTDFSGFDRRFIGRGLYLETLEGESISVYVAVDTSGSIDDRLLRLFLAEVHGILNAYPHLHCELYYADADAYGPYELAADSVLPALKGGGGTSFVPFFDRVRDRWDQQTPAVCVYLTDGYGEFPEQPPELPVLWVVTSGGLDFSAFPFGEMVRLV